MTEVFVTNLEVHSNYLDAGTVENPNQKIRGLTEYEATIRVTGDPTELIDSFQRNIGKYRLVPATENHVRLVEPCVNLFTGKPYQPHPTFPWEVLPWISGLAAVLAIAWAGSMMP